MYFHTINALELQNKLIQNIQSITDLNFLNALQTMISRKTDGYALTDAQQESVDVSRKQFKAGEFKDQNTMLKEMKNWLNEK